MNWFQSLSYGLRWAWLHLVGISQKRRLLPHQRGDVPRIRFVRIREPGPPPLTATDHRTPMACSVSCGPIRGWTHIILFQVEQPNACPQAYTLSLDPGKTSVSLSRVPGLKYKITGIILNHESFQTVLWESNNKTLELVITDNSVGPFKKVRPLNRHIKNAVQRFLMDVVFLCSPESHPASLNRCTAINSLRSLNL